MDLLMVSFTLGHRGCNPGFEVQLSSDTKLAVNC